LSPRDRLIASLLFRCTAPLPILLAFPTRRSSDLLSDGLSAWRPGARSSESRTPPFCPSPFARIPTHHGLLARVEWLGLEPELARSEEHTSELQSRFDLVCRLLLEKKNLDIYSHPL